MKHLDLFSGIGGFALAAEWVWPDIEHEFCDIEPFSREVLRKHWPESIIHEDIKELRGTDPVDLITGGFPCQPFSQAGKREGSEDNRYLWPEMLRVIRSRKPKWVVAENVYGILTLEGGVVFEEVCASLEHLGYAVWPFIIPACAKDAPHRRDRVWFLAHSDGKRRIVVEKEQEDERPEINIAGFERWFDDPVNLSLDVEGFFPDGGSEQVRNDDGLSEGVDRLKALGNAIVPQVAYEIFKAIKATGTL